jgi:hypothetical protein
MEKERKKEKKENVERKEEAQPKQQTHNAHAPPVCRFSCPTIMNTAVPPFLLSAPYSGHTQIKRRLSFRPAFLLLQPQPPPPPLSLTSACPQICCCCHHPL